MSRLSVICFPRIEDRHSSAAIDASPIVVVSVGPSVIGGRNVSAKECQAKEGKNCSAARSRSGGHLWSFQLLNKPSTFFLETSSANIDFDIS
ncbi:hypothetical protein CDAR_514351 [Caerostris darwini]|uniref:Uncharacterized protein n=1 Tax=Caerostris darwini TaxID=1538125 RepID=A0AAV4UN25_9ARAC|nr:hypothetical protein CDAR_514351 [Caerostris darwini]